MLWIIVRISASLKGWRPCGKLWYSYLPNMDQLLRHDILAWVLDDDGRDSASHRSSVVAVGLRLGLVASLLSSSVVK